MSLPWDHMRCVRPQPRVLCLRKICIWQSTVERNKEQEDQVQVGEESRTPNDEVDDNDEEPFFQHDGFVLVLSLIN